MLVLLMAPALSHELPSVVFEQPNQLSRERRPRDENVAVRATLGSAHRRAALRGALGALDDLRPLARIP